MGADSQDKYTTSQIEDFLFNVKSEDVRVGNDEFHFNKKERLELLEKLTDFSWDKGVGINDEVINKNLMLLSKNKNPKIRGFATKLLSTWEPNDPSFKKGGAEEKISIGQNSQLIIGNMLDDPTTKIIVDPANEKTMNGNGGVSGAIKSMYEKKGLLKSYVNDLLKFPKNEDGNRCPNGEARYTNTGEIGIIHVSAPDLREKENLQKGSKKEPSEKAKQKLQEAYYQAFIMAYHVNKTQAHNKPLSCPLLGAGIFKWPATLSAEIAGRAMQQFREEYGHDIAINLYMIKEGLKDGLTADVLKKSIEKGIVQREAESAAVGFLKEKISKLEIKEQATHSQESSILVEPLPVVTQQQVSEIQKSSINTANEMQTQLSEKEVLEHLIDTLNSVKKDNYQVYKPLAAQLKELIKKHESGPQLGAEASAAVQAILDKLEAEPELYPASIPGSIRGNILYSYETIRDRNTPKETKVKFSDAEVKYFDERKAVDNLEKESGNEALVNTYEEVDFRKKDFIKNKQEKLPSNDALQESSLKKVYVCLQAPSGKVELTNYALKKLTNNTMGLNQFEAVSKNQPNHFAITTDPERIVEWAAQLQEDLKGKPVIIVSMKIPEVLLQDGMLDNRVLGELNKANSELLNITGVTAANEFDVALETVAERVRTRDKVREKTHDIKDKVKQIFVRSKQKDLEQHKQLTTFQTTIDLLKECESIQQQKADGLSGVKKISTLLEEFSKKYEENPIFKKMLENLAADHKGLNDIIIKVVDHFNSDNNPSKQQKEHLMKFRGRAVKREIEANALNDKFIQALGTHLSTQPNASEVVTPSLESTGAIYAVPRVEGEKVEIANPYQRAKQVENNAAVLAAQKTWVGYKPSVLFSEGANHKSHHSSFAHATASDNIEKFRIDLIEALDPSAYKIHTNFSMLRNRLVRIDKNASQEDQIGAIKEVLNDLKDGMNKKKQENFPVVQTKAFKDIEARIPGLEIRLGNLEAIADEKKKSSRPGAGHREK